MEGSIAVMKFDGQPAATRPGPATVVPQFPPEQLRDALNWLARQPVLLLLLVLAMNAVRFPYLGRLHDAALYSFQAVNHLSGGQFSDDLFFKYGSQDRFSAFSTIVSPLVGLAGLDVAFFVLFLLSVALFYWSAIRLTRAITGNDTAVALTAMLIAVFPLWFGGLEIFQSNEAFFTPRLPACGLSLLALECVLNGRPGRAAACLIAALLLHPLMASGAILVALAYGAWGVIEKRSAVIKFAAIGIAAWLGLAGISVTGRFVPMLDDTWRTVIRQASPYNFPTDWQLSDWLIVVASSSIVSAGAHLMRARPVVARLLWLSVVVAVSGLGLTWFASGWTHSLLFQIQPYRALWLLTVLQIPCSVVLAAALWNRRAGAHRVLALLVCAYVLQTTRPSVQFQLTLVALAIAFLAVRLVMPGRRFVDDVWRTAAFGTAAGIFGVATMSGVHLLIQRNRLLEEFDPLTYLRLWLAVPGTFGWLVTGCGVAWVMSRRSTSRLIATTGLISCFLVVHSAACVLPLLSAYKHHFRSEEARNMDFVRSELGRLNAGRAPVTIYMDWGRADHVWIELHAKSYFHLTQVVGVLFNRQTAVEAARRAAIVAPFETARYSAVADFNPDIVRLMVKRLFPDPGDAGSVPALKQLCADPVLDYAVLRGSAVPAEISNNGSIRIYDCRQLRSGPS